MTLTEAELADRVHKGAKLLDFFRPNWYNEIDLSQFELACPGFCILGQIFGNFNDVKKALPIDMQEYGFTHLWLPDVDDNEKDDAKYQWKFLEEEWVKQIWERRKENIKT